MKFQNQIKNLQDQNRALETAASQIRADIRNAETDLLKKRISLERIENEIKGTKMAIGVLSSES